MKNISEDGYWEERYTKHDTPWDIGYANPGLVRLVREHFTPDSKLLIPGAGIGHEAGQLWQLGFRQIFTCDWSETAKEEMTRKYPEFPSDHVLIQDFFKLEGDFDGIIEQTFLCALPVDHRSNYVQKCAELLRDNGKFVGVLFNREFPFQGPPFGGSVSEYRDLFEECFVMEKLEPWDDSIPPRNGTECVIIARKSVGR